MNMFPKSKIQPNPMQKDLEIIIGMGCSCWYGTDAYPYEVVKIVSDRCVEVRSMNAVLDPSYKPDIIPGGFCGQCTNVDEQKWIYSSNENGSIIKVSLHKAKKKKGWFGSCGGKFYFGQARKVYDYNF